MKIKVDHREHTLIKLLKALCKDYAFPLEIVVDTLDIGDVVICRGDDELVILERKKLSDLAASIRDGRYKEQSYRLQGLSLHNHNIIYLIEGNMAHYTDRYSKVTHGTLYVSMFCLQYFKGFSVFRTFDVTESAEYILRMADKLRRETEKYGFYHAKFTPTKDTYTNVVHKVKKKNLTPENIGEIILSQIPGISSITSKAILAEFGSLYQLLQALDKNPQCLDNISYITQKNKQRRLSKTCIQNIIQYLLYQKSNIIKIKT